MRFIDLLKENYLNNSEFDFELIVEEKGNIMNDIPVLEFKFYAINKNDDNEFYDVFSYSDAKQLEKLVDKEILVRESYFSARKMKQYLHGLNNAVIVHYSLERKLNEYYEIFQNKMYGWIKLTYDMFANGKHVDVYLYRLSKNSILEREIKYFLER